jgi:hypothetical protein
MVDLDKRTEPERVVSGRSSITSVTATDMSSQKVVTITPDMVAFSAGSKAWSDGDLQRMYIFTISLRAVREVYWPHAVGREGCTIGM